MYLGFFLLRLVVLQSQFFSFRQYTGPEGGLGKRGVRQCAVILVAL